jgi:hypothetical protein
MRKMFIAGVAAIGLLAVGFTVMGHPASYNQADAVGSGADVRATGHNLIAMIDTDHSTRPVLVAYVRSASLARSLLV